METSGGVSARVQYALLRLSWTLRRSPLGRLVPPMSWMHDLVFSKSNTIQFRVGTEGILEVPLWDGYWTRVASGRRYEPEVENLLACVLGPTVAFVDGGANIGYWSAWALGRSETIVSVEASPGTYSRLERTAALNGDKFELIHAAMWADTGSAVEIVSHEKDHAAASAVYQQHNRGAVGYATHRVPTIGLRDIYDRHVQTGPLVVKLDLEKAEAEVLSSAWSLFEQTPVLCIYEDHPSDRQCLATAAVLQAGLPAWILDATGAVTPIESVEAALSQKKDPSRGYNFVTASRGTEFERLLHELAEAGEPCGR